MTPSKKMWTKKKKVRWLNREELFIFYLYTSSFQGLIISFSTFCFNEIFQFKYGPKERKNGEEQWLMIVKIYPAQSAYQSYSF